jgi:uncharacterized protein (UPF0332 family)
MPFDWPDYLTIADELSKRTTEEACLRTAISRTYYYVYHLARQRLLDNEFIIVRGGDTHKQVWEKYQGDADHRCKKLNDLAKILHDKRKQADYDNPYAGRIDAEFPALITLAKKFATDLNALEKRLPVNRGIKA